jgi:hypothetical protein
VRRQHLFSLIALAALLIVWPARADAQWHGHGRVFVGAGFYAPFWAYDPWYGYPFYGPYPYPYPYPYYAFDPGSSVRVEVKPKQAEVYVDGYYAGVVDDFDGVFQRLPVYPGDHEIELYLDGYRTVKQHVYTSAGRTFKLKYQMAKLGPGEQAEPRPTPPPQPPTPQAEQPGTVQRGPARPMPPPQAPPGQPSAQRPGASAYGSISIRVQPADADVLIDGEKWRGPESQDRLVIEVAEGRHTIEVQKAGYRTYLTDVEVRRGDTTTINVSLRSQDHD